MIRSSLIRLIAGIGVLAGSLPAQALDQNDVNEYIREQHAEECAKLGGSYSYPKCYLPEAKRDATPSESETCDWACQLVIGALGLATARVAFCKANPERC